MGTHNLCFEQKYEKKKISKSFLSENFQFLEVKFSIYLNRRVFVMISYISVLFGTKNVHDPCPYDCSLRIRVVVLGFRFRRVL